MIVGDGRPLRFLALIGVGWVGIRVLFLWHATGSLPQAVRGVIPHADAIVADTRSSRTISGARTASAPHIASTPVRTPASSTGPVAAAQSPMTVAADPVRVQLALLALLRVAGTSSEDPPDPLNWAAVASLSRVAPQPPRLSFSSWMIARSGAGIGGSTLSPQLGGTQGGVRVDYALTRGIAATARLAAPAAGAGRELSLGVAWRPSGVPLRFVAEQRVAIDGGRGGPALGVSGGVSAARLPAGFRLEGYGQAGAIARSGIETYIDASMRAVRPVADLGGIALDVGGGAWGGAQRGVARVDIGPSIGARVPLAGQPVRVSLDWRHRIAGNARPGSGPALTIGADF